ncbi:hypothetical protein BT93_L4610 [Corymbia citriodora subsp. variegata]|uniref:Secreted protein n=1 Tax=Corymbia citriodora subsp. variegata TaxID=360336 RepID=A0A8T0CXI4_CORYI|nr:hypothetical protein BT93_L4610 [Corymbia citriodora subsp. variegata]
MLSCSSQSFWVTIFISLTTVNDSTHGLGPFCGTPPGHWPGSTAAGLLNVWLFRLQVSHRASFN